MKTFPYAVEPIDDELKGKVNASLLGVSDGSVKVGPKKYIFPYKYGEVAESIYNTEVRPSDVWIVTYPRSGTTIAQDIIWLTVKDDYESATNIFRNERFPFLESTLLVTNNGVKTVKNLLGNDEEKLSKFFKSTSTHQWEVIQDMPDRRLIKSHMPLSLLPPDLLISGAKVIYVARNPKNVAISRYYQERSLGGYKEDFESYWDLFHNDLVMYSPYWEHLKEAWNQKDNKNLLFLFYEDIIKSYRKTIVEISKFLETPLSDEQISRMEQFLDIDSFRKVHNRRGASVIPMDNYEHVRKGKSGNWDDHFTEKLNREANMWIKENYSKTSMRFPIELY